MVPLPLANRTSRTRPKREAASAALVSKALISSASLDQLAALSWRATQGALWMDGRRWLWPSFVWFNRSALLLMRAVGRSGAGCVKCGCRVDWRSEFRRVVVWANYNIS